MGVNLNDFFDFEKKLKGFSTDIKGKFIQEVLNRTANETKKAAQKNTPVQTGDLRRKWGVVSAKSNGSVWTAEVFNPNNYAVYVEEGHPTSRAGIARWVPGVWRGNQFIYIKGYKDGGMLVKPQIIKGAHMLEKGVESTEKGLEQYLSGTFEKYLRKYFGD